MNKAFLVLLFLVACAPAPVIESTPTPEPTQTPEPVVEKEPEVVKVSEPVEIKEPEVAEEPGACDTFGCLPGDTIVADVQMDLFYECHCARAKWIKPEFILCFANEEEAIGRGYRKAGSC